MEQYINKADIIAEIEKAIDETAPSHDQQCQYEDGYYCGLYKAESIIDTLEVKEVDLEEEIKSWLDHGHITDTRYGDYDDDDIESTARHFFELGIKAWEGE